MQGTNKRMMKLMLAGILAVAMFAGCGKKEKGLTLDQVQSQTEEQDRSEEESAPGEETEETLVICVYVCGQVISPGVYELPSGSRIYQAVEAAGGMTQAADQVFVNQAELMEDGQRIYIPSVDEVQAGEVEESGGESGASDGILADGRVNINTAGKEELMTLTGIGEKRAEAIIQYRDANGGFHTTEELMQVSGIKEGTFEKIKEDIVI